MANPVLPKSNPIKSDIQSQTSRTPTGISTASSHLADDDFIALDAVGMSNIQTAVVTSSGLTTPALLDFVVNLRSGRRGIHMSRLYELMMRDLYKKNLHELNFHQFLSDGLQSQMGDSSKCRLSLRWSEVVDVPALKSQKIGARTYPVHVTAQIHQEVNSDKSSRVPIETSVLQLEFEVQYSSTCPQSLALSQELTQEIFLESSQDLANIPGRFVATPHAQRSRMMVALQFDLKKNQTPLAQLKLDQIIRAIEAMLQTPVQTIVKKADEMEFARLNAENPMFCEDAVRRVALGLLGLLSNWGAVAYKIATRHEESLHAHDAIATVSSSKFTQF